MSDSNQDDIIFDFSSKSFLLSKIYYLISKTITGRIILIFWIFFIGQYVIYSIFIGPVYITEGSNITISEQWSSLFTVQLGEESNYWTFITSIFSHGNLIHILVNSLVFASFGLLIEQDHSSTEYILLFLIGGLLTGIFQILIANIAFNTEILHFRSDDEFMFLGASGAIAVIIGACVAKRPESEVYILFLPFFNFNLLIVSFIFTLFSLIIVIIFGVGAFNLAHIAHASGIIIGFLYGLNRYGLWRVQILLEKYYDNLVQ